MIDIFAKRYGWNIEYILGLTRRQVRLLLTSMGDHERLPKSEKDQHLQKDLTESEKSSVITKKHLTSLRKGVNLKHKSKVIDRLVGKTMGEYVEELNIRSKGGKIEGKGDNGGGKPKTGLKSAPIPVKKRVSNLTIPKKAVPVVSNEIRNEPINVNSNNDMAKIWNLASQGKSGFKMTNRLKKTFQKRK